MKPSTPQSRNLFGTLCVAACLCCALPRAFAAGTAPAPPNAAPQPTASAADLRKQAEDLKYKDPKASAALYAQLVAGDATPADKADDLDDQAYELLVVGDWKTAEPLARQALDLHKQASNARGEGKSERIIALVLSDQGKDQDAIGLCESALVLDRNVHDADEEANALRVEGIAYDELSQHLKAIDDYTQALPIYRAAGDRDGEANALNNTGVAYEDLSQYAKAIDDYTQALPIFRAVGDRDGEAIDLNNLLCTMRDQAGSPRNAPLAAVAFGKQAVNLLQQIRSEISGLDKTAQQVFVKSKESTYRDLADILIAKGRLAEAEQVLAMLKEQEYFDFIGHDRAAAPSLNATVAFTPEEQIWIDRYDHLGDTVENVQATVTALAKAKQQDTPEYVQAKAQLKTASDAFTAFVTELPKRFVDPGKGTETAKQIQASRALERVLTAAQGEPWHLRACAVYTVEADSQYDVVFVTPNGQRAGAYAITASALNAKVEKFRQAILDKAHDPKPLAKELYDIMLGPIAKDIDAYQPDLVMWSLDGPLSLVPVSALYDGKSNQYLVQRWQTELFNADSIPTISDSGTSHSFAGALGMGVSKGRTVGKDNFGDLAEVPDELSGIFHDPAHKATGPVPGAYLLDGSFKTSDALARLQEGGHHLVHLATHFNLDSAGSASSYLLTGDGVISLADLNASGNIFNDVDLLTLSACSTAVGSDDGNGLDSTAQLLGARAILATLWDVSDASTGVFMKDFYGHMTASNQGTNGKPMTTAEAVREAQLSLLGVSASPLPPKTTLASTEARRGTRPVPVSGETALPEYVPDPAHPYAHPYYWAPFILLGNWR